MGWKVRELVAKEAHDLRRAVQLTAGPTFPARTRSRDCVTRGMHHVLDNGPGAWHLGAVDERGGDGSPPSISRLLAEMLVAAIVAGITLPVGGLIVESERAAAGRTSTGA